MTDSTNAEKFDAKAEDFASETTDRVESLTAEPKREEKPPLDALSEVISKTASEAGYAVAGFAGFIGDKAKALYEDQRKSYFAAHPDKGEGSQDAKKFLDQLSRQLGRLVEDATKAYKDFAGRGKETVQNLKTDAPKQDAATDDARHVDIETLPPIVDEGVAGEYGRPEDNA